MASIGVITLEIRLEHSHSLKDKRQVIRRLKERLRSRHNVSVSEIDYQDLWQRGLLAAVTVSSDHSVAERTLQAVENDALVVLGPMLVNVNIEWMD